MTTAELVNRIIAKLHPQSRVEFKRIGSELIRMQKQVVFRWGNHDYICEHDGKRIVVRYLEHNSELYQRDNNYSRWVEGVLNGGVRDDAGELQILEPKR